MAHSDAVYVIHDRAIKADVFMFMAQHDGIAKGHLHSFCNRCRRTDFALYRVAAFDCVEDEMAPVNADRVYLCDAKPEYLEAEDGNLEA
ncbi:TPA: hypothetical protein ACP2HE_004945 [Escherichia coli]